MNIAHVNYETDHINGGLGVHLHGLAGEQANRSRVYEIGPAYHLPLVAGVVHDGYTHKHFVPFPPYEKKGLTDITYTVDGVNPAGVATRLYSSSGFGEGAWQRELCDDYYADMLRRAVPNADIALGLLKTGQVQVVHVHDRMDSATVPEIKGRGAADGVDVPVVYTIHSESHGLAKANHCPVDWVMANNERVACNNADAVIAVSDYTERQLRELYGVDPKKLYVCRNGIDPVDFYNLDAKRDEMREYITKMMEWPKDSLMCLHVGRSCNAWNGDYFYDWKGQIPFILAAAQLRNARHDIKYILIAHYSPHAQRPGQWRYHGDDLLQTERQRWDLIKSLGLETDFLFINDQIGLERFGYYAACDVVVVPSRVEHFGITVTEGMAAGKPVIGSAGTGHEDQLTGRRETDFGYLCNEGALIKPDDNLDLSARRIANAIERVSPEMGLAGKKRARAFTWKNIAHDVEQVYNRIL